MSNSDSYFNFSNILLLSGLLIALGACRKEIDHEVGYSNNSTSGGWDKISSVGVSEVTAIQVYKNELYIASYSNFTTPKLIKYTSSGEEIVVLSNFDSGQILAMEVFEDHLYLGGNFHYSNGSVDANSLLRMDSLQNVEGLNYSPPASTWRIHDLNVVGSDLIIAGYFPQSAAGAATQNIDRMQGLTSLSMGGHPNKFRETVEHNSIIYGVGMSNTFVSWDGSSWNSVPYNTTGGGISVHSIASYNSEIFLMGDFPSNIVLKKGTPGGTWTNFTEITDSYAYPNFTGFELLNGELYACMPSNYELNGESAVSGVLKYNGISWEPVGTIGRAYTMEYFNGYLFLGNDKGLYRYKL